jgi:proteasome accessory factor B
MAGDASERIVNLALYLASAGGPVTADEISANVAAYPPGQDEDAFLRMFERDKADLRNAGFVISVDGGGESDAYRLDARATFAEPVELDRRETAEVRAAGAALLTDPSFPYARDLRFAMAKLMARAGTPASSDACVVSALTADEDSDAQSITVAALTAAAAARKRATFAYTGANGRHTAREIEPWGLFARDGRWYLVGFDRTAGGARVFAVARVRDLHVETSRPKTADFERPADFDVRRWMLMPFQYGERTHEVVLELRGTPARSAQALTAGQGTLKRVRNGVLEWRVRVADEDLLAQWVVEHSPGITILEPASARAAIIAGLRRAANLHG